MNEMTVPDDLKGLLENQRFCVLATTDSGHPYTNLVSFAATEDLKKILFATRRQTNKFKNISSESRTAVFIDNRGNSPDDIKKAITVTALGHSKEVGEGKKEKLKIYLDKHPYLEDFIQNPDCALMELNVSNYIYVKEFEVKSDIKV
jgi:general stress protein 26